MPVQVLTIEPQHELKFKVDLSGHFEHGYTSYMRLINPTNDTVLFKIKTTAPKKYCVRPNSGGLEPHTKVDIAITPQPVFVEANEKHKHKFMVQSVIAPEGKTNVDQVWKEISPDQLMDYKLKCVFEAPRGANDAGDTANQNEVTKKRVSVADDNVTSTKEAVTEAKKGKDADHENGTNHTNIPTIAEIGEVDLQKVTAEVVLLREEESKLRHENLLLKEEMTRLRMSASAGRRHSFGPAKNPQALPLPWAVVAVVMALIGIIIGKLFM